MGWKHGQKCVRQRPRDPIEKVLDTAQKRDADPFGQGSRWQIPQRLCGPLRSIKREGLDLFHIEQKSDFVNMLGGSLSRFRPDDYQAGSGILWEMARGGVQGLQRSRNPLKAPGNTLKGLKAGVARGVKRKAEQVIKKELNKRAKKALSNKNVQTIVQAANALFPKQTKKARDIFGV